MRGSGDTAIDLTQAEAIVVLENVVAAQRQIFTSVFGNESDVTQMWALYKEVQGYYEAGMRVPDDVTLLWTDDNFGNIRRLPLSNETSRSGGAGVYYHFDYVGDPRDYVSNPNSNFHDLHELASCLAREKICLFPPSQVS